MVTMDPYATKLLILFAGMFIAGLIAALHERRQRS